MRQARRGRWCLELRRSQSLFRRTRTWHGGDPERYGGARGHLPFGATFLIFSDYMRPPIRLAALMGLHVIYVFTHDSIALGQDGPTHQPVEQLAGLRAVPGLTVIRPGDANETASLGGWRWRHGTGRLRWS